MSGFTGAALERVRTVVLPLAAGRIVGGKYELVQQLGWGSMGEVWVANHRTLSERVAVKLLARGSEGSVEDAATAAARFRFEAHVAARLSRGTRHVVRVTDHGEEGALSYLVMELLEGHSLDTLLMRYGPVPAARLALLVGQVARGLDHAHAEGVVHRDLKPANIFITQDEDGTPLVKLLDFGIARSVRPVPDLSPYSTASNVILGTPGYMSPEHLEGAAIPDLHCDLWALATVAYEALAGELPVMGIHPEELIANLLARRFVPVRERVADLPRALDGFFGRAFADRVEDRYQSASELARAFECALGDRSLTDEHPEEPRPWSAPSPPRGVATKANAARSAPTDPPKPGRNAVRGSRRSIVSLAVAGAGVVAIGVGWVVGFSPRPSPPPPVATASAAVVAAVAAPPAETAAPILQEERAESMPTSVAARASTLPIASPPAAPATRARRDCSTPYEFDAEGTKRWKRECL